jgi:hypothetical protein
MNLPEVQSTGDAYTFIWASDNYRIRFDRLVEERGSLQSEIAVQTNDIIEETGRRGHIHIARFNVSSTQSRSSLAKYLTLKQNTVDWSEMLETACYYTLDEFRKGKPVVSSLAVEPIGKPSYFVSRLLPENESTVIFAEGGSGKSWFALALAIAVATGKELPLGIKPKRKCNILYLDWETHATEFRRRVDWLCAGFSIPHPEGVFYRQCTRKLSDDAAAIREAVIEHKIGFVVVDSIAYALGGEPENAYTAMGAMNTIRSLTGTTRLILAHMSKGGGDQAKATPFGSVFFRESARTVWEMRGNDSEPQAIGLFQRKSNYIRDRRPIGLELIIDDKNELAMFAPYSIEEEETTLTQHAPLSERIRIALRRGARTTSELITVCQANAANIRTTLSRMSDVTRINDGGKGSSALYGLKNKGQLDL